MNKLLSGSGASRRGQGPNDFNAWPDFEYACYPGPDAASVRFEIYPASQRPESDLEEVPLRESVGPSIVLTVLSTDARLAARLRVGRSVRVHVRLAGSGLIPAPKQKSAVAALIRPMLEPAPELTHLYPYQREGTQWLLDHRSALLADEMGLGKTIQVISALRVLVSLGKAKHTVVLCPKSLVQNWLAELRKWSPELVIGSFEGPVSPLEVRRLLGRHHVVVANYERSTKWEDAVTDVLVADEAHRIRNIDAEISQGIRSIDASRKWAITGTPIERDLEDFATIMSFLDPARFAADDSRRLAATLRSRAAPYVLRRTRAAVLKDLPEVVEHNEVVDLLPAQRKTYDALLETANRPSVDYIALIGELRQACDYDARSGESIKIRRALEILREIAVLNEKAIVFSYLIEPLRIMHRVMEDSGHASGYLLFDGSLDMSARRWVVERFKTDPSVRALLASTRATSEGLTLTEANHVIFLNRWWNPSANQQARDRAVRIGQERVVHIYSFTCRDTIEENLERILAEKGETYREVVDQLSDSARISKGSEHLAKLLVSGR